MCVCMYACMYVYMYTCMYVCVCIQYTDAGLYTCSQGERDHKIPGSYGHYEQDAQTYADWGVECKAAETVELILPLRLCIKA